MKYQNMEYLFIPTTFYPFKPIKPQLIENKYSNF